MTARVWYRAAFILGLLGLTALFIAAIMELSSDLASVVR